MHTSTVEKKDTGAVTQKWTGINIYTGAEWFWVLFMHKQFAYAP
jgi:hypothetical protein